MKFSLCMIVRDEEAVLSRCLESAKNLADELVIVDTGSTDQTVEIAKRYTEHVYFLPWQDDFSLARNYAFSKASGDYLLWLDADDVIPPCSQAQIASLREFIEKELPDMLTCPYEVGFDENGNPALTYFRERFFRRASNFQWQGRVHECIAPRGKVLHSEFKVAHLGSQKPRGKRNLEIYQKWAAEEALSPRDQFYYGRELFYHGLYAEAICVLEKMIAGDGWYVNQIEACRTLGNIYAAQGNCNAALKAYFQSFCFGEPRAFVCFEIAKLFHTLNRLPEAIFWYETALSCKDHSAEGDFEDPACRGINPLLQLVCCYYASGDFQKAAFYHKKTEEIAPSHPSVLFNRQFFSSDPQS